MSKRVYTGSVAEGTLNNRSRKSARATRLYNIKKEAKKIRQLHAGKEITAEEAAKRLSDLYSSRKPRWFKRINFTRETA